MLWIILILLAAEPAVRIQTSEGSSVEGTLLAIDAEQIEVREADAPKQLALDTLQSIEFPGNSSLSPEYSLGLRDGTVVAFREIETGEDDSELKVSSRSTGDLAIGIDDLRWIRFRAPRQAANERWAEFVAQPRPADMLVIRRSSGALDAINGVVLGIDQDKVQFDLDGQQIAAPRDRLEGVLFRDPSGGSSKNAPAVARVYDSSGSEWAAGELKFAADAAASSEQPRLSVTTTTGLEVAIAFSDLVRIAFSSGDVALIELEPLSVAFTPFFDLGLSEPVMRKLARAPNDDNAPNEIVLRGRTTLEYRIPDEVSTFTAEAKLLQPNAPVTLSLRLDGNETKSFTLSADTPQIAIAVDVSAARRLEISYDGFPASGVGDRVILHEPSFAQ